MTDEPDECRAAREQFASLLDLIEHLDGDETGRERARLHLETCVDCAAEMEGVRAAVNQFKLLAESFPSHPELAALAEGRDERRRQLFDQLSREGLYAVPPGTVPIMTAALTRLATLGTDRRHIVVRDAIRRALAQRAAADLSRFTRAWDAASVAASGVSAYRGGEDEGDDPVQTLVSLVLLVRDRPEEQLISAEVSMALERGLSAEVLNDFWAEVHKNSV